MMDFSQIGFVGLVVIVCIDALKEQFPGIKGNLTRLIALVIGGAIGLLFQVGILHGVQIDLIGGVFAGVAAVAGNTLIMRAGGETAQRSESQ
jgi:hypothetical protein